VNGFLGKDITMDIAWIRGRLATTMRCGCCSRAVAVSGAKVEYLKVDNSPAFLSKA